MSKAQFLCYLGLVKRPVKTTATLAYELSCGFKLKKKKSVFFKADKLKFFGVASLVNFPLGGRGNSDVSFMSQ
jgi:hypothetical protein